ncbi:8103_t:CDS:2 [Cetraspora pellucida]|uniref:8103_t:CDS:1 n=1 Tax=Cetraspora pellucida TaxID=1433469 RepID=A0A9N9NK01_9GLOM|nr:8103_t:CDS:2 [Cetraspora pellucida]
MAIFLLATELAAFSLGLDLAIQFFITGMLAFIFHTERRCQYIVSRGDPFFCRYVGFFLHMVCW